MDAGKAPGVDHVGDGAVEIAVNPSREEVIFRAFDAMVEGQRFIWSSMVSKRRPGYELGILKQQVLEKTGGFAKT